MLVTASGMGGLGEGVMLALIAMFVMPATALVAAILTWLALQHGLEWSQVRAAAIVLAVPYGMALLIGRDLSGPALLFDFMTMGFPEAFGLLNPMAAIAIAIAVTARSVSRSGPAGPDAP